MWPARQAGNSGQRAVGSGQQAAGSGQCAVGSAQWSVVSRFGMALERYSRQVLFSPIGQEGQARIRAGVVTIVGCGALGSASAEMLARAGVGTIRIVDRDFVDLTNLQRQTLFNETHAREGVPKAVAAARVLSEINSEVRVEERVDDLTFANVQELCGGSNVVVDGTDNFETRFLLNDFSVESGTPWIYGACVGSVGAAFAFVPGQTACFRCLFPVPPETGTAETCDTAGILSSVVHVVAAYQVTQTLRILCGHSPNAGLLQVDVWTNSWRTAPLGEKPDPSCECCGLRRMAYLTPGAASRTTRLCGRNAVQISPPSRLGVSFEALAERLSGIGSVQFNSYMMRITVDTFEIALFPDGRAIIRGTDDPAQAKSVYARYIGG